MTRAGRFSSFLQVLRDMSGAAGPVTSGTMIKPVQTNPVVIRRNIAVLREAGLVRSEKGHGSGWTTAKQLSSMRLSDIYAALGTPEFLAQSNRTEAFGCLFEQAVNARLNGAFRHAAGPLPARFAEITLAGLSADFHARMSVGGSAVDERASLDEA